MTDVNTKVIKNYLDIHILKMMQLKNTMTHFSRVINFYNLL